MGEIDDGPPQDVWIVPKEHTKLVPRAADDPLFGRYVSQSGCDAEQSRIGRHDRVIPTKQQHPMDPCSIKLAEKPQRAACRIKTATDGRRQVPVATKGFGARPERVQPQLE